MNNAVETLSKWMIHHSFATGHGDTVEGLLNELSWQIAALRSPGMEPTDEMLEAGWERSHPHVLVADNHPLKVGVKKQHAELYNAMIAARPKS